VLNYLHLRPAAPVCPLRAFSEIGPFPKQPIGTVCSGSKRVTRTLMFPLPKCRISTILASFLIVLSTGMPERAVAEPIQSQSDFENAFRGQLSTSQPLVLITVVDDRTHQSRTGCTGANFLIGALILEHLGGYSKTNSDNVKDCPTPAHQALRVGQLRARGQASDNP
jgi:hypothetical protein